MIVPSLVSLGLGSLLLANSLAMTDVVYAAPAGQGSPPDAKASGIARPVAAGKAGKAPLATDKAPDPTAGNEALARLAEFGSSGTSGGVVKATPEEELAARAVEAAGREDPFLMLVPPNPGAIVLPVEAPPAPKLPPIAFVPAPANPPLPVKPLGPEPPPRSEPITPVRPPALGPVVPPLAAPVLAPPVVAAPAVPRTPGRVAPPVPEKPFGGDKPPTIEQPQWLVRGIVSTGYERICMLEGSAGNHLSARVGDNLADGSVIEAISNRGVTFLRGGRRFVKIIGGVQ